jgi:hypothetical protein
MPTSTGSAKKRGDVLFYFMIHPHSFKLSPCTSDRRWLARLAKVALETP